MTAKTFKISNGFEVAKLFGLGAVAAVSLGLSAAQSHASTIQPQHVSFYSDAFAYGHVNKARADLKAMYPAGAARVETVVDDLQRAGATCSLDGAAGFACVRHDSLIQQELATPETWTVRVSANADGLVSKIDLSQSLGGGR
jgi:hypothetical protein